MKDRIGHLNCKCTNLRGVEVRPYIIMIREDFKTVLGQIKHTEEGQDIDKIIEAGQDITLIIEVGMDTTQMVMKCTGGSIIIMA